MSGILVETDLIVEFLTAGPGETPLLRRLLEATRCYTTFIQAAEIYAAARGEEELRMVERTLFGLKILGGSSRYSKTIGEVLTSLGSMRDHRTAIVAAMALEARIPLVTGTNVDKYSPIPGLRVLSAATLRASSDANSLRAMIDGE